MKSILAFAALVAAFSLVENTVINTVSGKLEYTESWGYTTVRPNAHMFWWLYYSTASSSSFNANRPLYMWLQGGPGSSGCGFGNFQEFGPLDDKLQPRNTTWLQKGDILFVDNPVGTGFSYVTDKSAYTTNVQQISADLLYLLMRWFRDHPQYQTRPFYIISESYGGKMTAHFASVLYPAIKSGKVRANFKGVGLGDSWISPMDFVNSWGPYLYWFSMLSDTDLKTVNAQAAKCQSLVNQGQWSQATVCWDQTEQLVGRVADDVSWYNVLKKSGTDALSVSSTFIEENAKTPVERLAMRHLPHLPDPAFTRLYNLMNGPVKRKLGIIPANVTWGGQGGNVFSMQYGDFMKDVIGKVDYLLKETPLKVIVYNGQLDLICDTVGVEMWMQNLTWPGLPTWRKQQRIPFHAGPSPLYMQTAGFVKKYQNLYFYWIMRAGHMVPADAPYAALRMLSTVFN